MEFQPCGVYLGYLLSNAYLFVLDSMNLITTFLIDIFCYSCTLNILLLCAIQVWGTVIMQKRYQGPDYFLAFLVTLGCSAFILHPVLIVSLTQFFFYCFIITCLYAIIFYYHLSLTYSIILAFCSELMLHVGGIVISFGNEDMVFLDNFFLVHLPFSKHNLTNLSFLLLNACSIL